MKDIVRLLPEHLANQIAAGEVVQRPASVVKELLENAVDAGAKHITLQVTEGGKTLLHCVDDGKGMSYSDARMAFERHATSKIASQEDLFKINTLGFRGEALASIAAVAQVELKTRQEDEELGTQVVIEAGEVKKYEAVATAKGTSLSIKNLFYNVPARRKFLKSRSVEMRHILEEFYRVALANPEVHMTLYQNDLETANLKTDTSFKRIQQVLGKSSRQSLLPVEEETPYIKVSGYLSKPETAKKGKAEQYLFINNRFFKSSYLHHAIITGYDRLIPDRAQPAYVVFLEVDIEHLDINVHPSKTEIKFDDERLVYQVLHAATRQALISQGVQALDFDLDTNFDLNFDKAEKVSTPQFPTEQNQPKPDFLSGFTPTERSFPERSSAPPSSNLELSDLGLSKQQAQSDKDYSKLFRQDAPLRPTDPSIEDAGTRPQGKLDGLLSELLKAAFIDCKGDYLLAPVEQGLFILKTDQARERIVFDRLWKAYQDKSNSSQRLLYPLRIHLEPRPKLLFDELKGDLEELGFSFGEFSGDEIQLLGVPAQLARFGDEGLFEEFLKQMEGVQHLSSERQRKLVRFLARKRYLQKVGEVSVTEARGIVRELFKSDDPSYSPSGSKIWAIAPLNVLEKMF